jgi:hypothetical protein
VVSQACGLFICATGRAHPAPSSLALIDLTLDGAQLEQDVPLEELELALHQKLVRAGEDPSLAVRRNRSLLLDYARAHVEARTAEGDRKWEVFVRDVRAHIASDGPRATFDIVMRAPSGDASSAFELRDDIVTHEVVSHHSAIFVRSDWTASRDASSRLAGTLHAGRNVVTITRGGSFWQGFRRVVELGAEHIATGTDHLLFLFALVLVAPVIAMNSRWKPGPSNGAALGQLLRVVTAFTVGHSLTLGLAAIGGLVLPGDIVEIGIALSVLLAGCNALRPIFAGQEALLALAFGLVHGLAFASTIAEKCLGTAQTAWTLLGFNLGIELAQLALLSLLVPWLLLMARTPAYVPFRVGGAALTAVFAVGWLLERTEVSANPTAPMIAWLEEHPLLLLIALACGTMLARTLSSHGRSTRDGADSLAADNIRSEPMPSDKRRQSST